MTLSLISVPFRPNPNVRIRVANIAPKTGSDAPAPQFAQHVFGCIAQIDLARLFIRAEGFARGKGPVALDVETHIHEPFHALLHNGDLDDEFTEGGPDDEIDDVDVRHEELVGRRAEPFGDGVVGLGRGRDHPAHEIPEEVHGAEAGEGVTWGFFLAKILLGEMDLAGRTLHVYTVNHADGPLGQHARVVVHVFVP
jgi:hypothetical protein